MTGRGRRKCVMRGRCSVPAVCCVRPLQYRPTLIYTALTCLFPRCAVTRAPNPPHHPTLPPLGTPAQALEVYALHISMLGAQGDWKRMAAMHKV